MSDDRRARHGRETQGVEINQRRAARLAVAIEVNQMTRRIVQPDGIHGNSYAGATGQILQIKKSNGAAIRGDLHALRLEGRRQVRLQGAVSKIAVRRFQQATRRLSRADQSSPSALRDFRVSLAAISAWA